MVVREILRGLKAAQDDARVVDVAELRPRPAPGKDRDRRNAGPGGRVGRSIRHGISSLYFNA